jgi:glucokinase
MNTYIAGVDIGGTKVAVTLANRTGIVQKIQAPVVTHGARTAIAEQAWGMIVRTCEAQGIAVDEVSALGVSTCSPFVNVLDAQGRSHREVAAPNLCGGMGSNPYQLKNDWSSFPLASYFDSKVATVIVENDAVATLQAERTFGAAQGSENCVYATWSTGIGFGLCVDGRLLGGKRGNAGHAGHSYFAENEAALCGCGNYGDTEALLSGHALARQWQAVSGIGSATTLDFFTAAQSGNQAAQALLEQAAERFGTLLYNLTVILDTDVFVLGGSVFSHHQAVLMPLIIKRLGHGMTALTRHVRVVPAALGERTADLGALSLVMPAPWVSEWLALQSA